VKLDTIAYLDNEFVAVKAINLVASTVTVDRGVLDTVPAPHLAAARLWFADAVEALITEQYLSAETLQVKMLPATGLGRLAESAAPADSYTFAGRMIRPYPPGNVKINNVMWPTVILGQASVTWAYRDRMQQTVYLVTQSEANIGPEAGTTYTIRVYGESGALRKTVTGITTTSWSYLVADEVTDSGLGRLNGKLKIEVEAVRDGYASWQRQTRSFDRAGFGLNYGKYYGGT
jgi:hypothetical protein